MAGRTGRAGRSACFAQKGETARQLMEEGVELMSAGHLSAAARIFLTLTKQHPDWAEAINKRLAARVRRLEAELSKRGIHIAAA